MNSIRRPRRRPRVESVSLKVLGWVLVREAALRVCYRTQLGTTRERQARMYCSGASTHAVRTLAERYIRLSPERRFYP